MISGGGNAQYADAIHVGHASSVYITGGTISSARGIDAMGRLYISGGIVLASGTYAISSWGDTYISGGTIAMTPNATGTPIFNSYSSLTISGGTIRANGAHALSTHNGAITIITDGLLFAHNTNANDAVTYDGPNMTFGDAIIMAWNRAAGNRVYTASATSDIFVYPSAATALWTRRNGVAGISYFNGANTGFIDIPEVTVVGDLPDDDDIDITAAKALIEGTTFGPVSQVDVNTAEEAFEYVEGVIANLTLNDVAAVVAGIDFTAAVAGTSGNPSGTNGFYTFTVTLSKGAGTPQVTGVLELVIIATSAVSILSPDREIPDVDNIDDVAIVTPINKLTAQFTAGPNPVSKSAGTVNFFWQGGWIDDAVLTIFDASGNVVNRVEIADVGAGLPYDEINKFKPALTTASPISTDSRRIVGSWDLTDRKGRTVVEGAYLARGMVVTVDGKRERVSLILGVR
jgi:hypothetical protein